jgi:hypothetical protein
VPLIVGTGAIRQPDSIAMAEHAAKIGADAILVGSPPYAVPTERENALNALAIDRAADLPVMLYNYPGRMGVDMGEEFLDRVGRSRNFCAIKESSGDINRVHLLARDYPHIQLSCGMDDQALEFFAWGARSWVCGGSTSCPRAYRALPGLRGGGRFRQGAADHVGDAAADAGARTGRQVRPVHQARLRDGGMRRRAAAPAAEGAQQGRQAATGTGGAGPETDHRGDRGGGLSHEVIF